MEPFIKWAGGKRWLFSNPDFALPNFTGRYIEPFFGGGAVFFNLQPASAIVSDINGRLMEVYQVVRDDWERLVVELEWMQKKHSNDFYYAERARKRKLPHKRAAQFLYLNRTCWNGLYRENKKGEFNVPIGTKSKVFDCSEDFSKISELLAGAEIKTCDFQDSIDLARSGDLVFLDPPYTTAHNLNGFVKYNQKIFSWDDQVRLKSCVESALGRGVKVVLTNADHATIHELYRDVGQHSKVCRSSIIAGSSNYRRHTTEALYVLG